MNPLINKYAVIVLMAVLFSCTKNGHSISYSDAASINIFNASHVYDSMYKQRMVWFSGYDTASGLKMLFTQHDIEIPGNGQLEAIRIDHPMQFYDFNAGRQQVKFSDTGMVTVADTSLDFSSGSYNGIYLAEDTTRIDAFTRSGRFKIFKFTEERTNTTGKVRVRYIDLVPDIDTLNGYIFTPTVAKFTSEATPNALVYGEASRYYDLDTAGLVISGNILLRLFPKKDTLNYNVQIPIPATPGRTYTVLVFGNASYWPCRFSIKQPDGSVTQKSINYPPNIKGYVRTVY